MEAEVHKSLLDTSSALFNKFKCTTIIFSINFTIEFFSSNFDRLETEKSDIKAIGVSYGYPKGFVVI